MTTDRETRQITYMEVTYDTCKTIISCKKKKL